MDVDKVVSSNRPIERDAVNAIRYFFEHHNIPFFEVDLRVDFGKDAVIELVEQNLSTGLWVGLQIKGGDQTHRRVDRNESRGIPYTAKDCKSFRGSNIPVIGFVRTHPDRFDEFLWVDLRKTCSEAFERSGKDTGGFAEARRRLSEYHLRAFVEEMRVLATSEGGNPALQLVNSDAEVQQQAVFDCFVLARSDPRPMIVARRLLRFLSHEAVGTLIAALAPIVGHGDIMYGPRNILPTSTRMAITSSLNWSRDDMAILLEFIGEDDEEQMWGRGTFGQNICAVVSKPRDSLLNLILLAEDRRSYSVLARRRAYMLALYLASDNAPEISARILRHSHDLVEDDHICSVARHVEEFGCFDLY